MSSVKRYSLHLTRVIRNSIMLAVAFSGSCYLFIGSKNTIVGYYALSFVAIVFFTGFLASLVLLIFHNKVFVDVTDNYLSIPGKLFKRNLLHYSQIRKVAHNTENCRIFVYYAKNERPYTIQTDFYQHLNSEELFKLLRQLAPEADFTEY